MSGTKPGENVSAATVVALIEQGLKVFSGIYKRLFRAFAEEFKLIYRLNSRFLREEEYVNVLDLKVSRDDFNVIDQGIIPAADPQFSLDSQRAAKADALMKISGRPGLDEDRITQLYLAAVKAPKDVYMPPENRPEPPPNPEMVKVEIEQGRLDIEKRESSFKTLKLFAEMEELRSQAIANIAKAEGEEEGQQIERYRLVLDELGQKMEALRNEGGNVSGVDRGPKDAGVSKGTA